MCFRVGIDVGGTFTDIVVLNEKTGEIIATKVPSTPEDQSIGVVNAIKKLGDKFPYENLSFLVHGTTVATNALLERKGARTALVVTEGFRDILYIGRQTRPHLYNEWVMKPEPPVPRYLTFEVPERMRYDGEVIKELDVERAREVINKLKSLNVESVAVCFLHSYVNPSHERKFAELLKKEAPGIRVSVSSDIMAEFREFERASTTVLNAYLMPLIERYLSRLVKRKDELGIKKELHVMRSDGGIMSSKTAAEQSVHTIFSGLAGGALIGPLICEQTGIRNVITLDMGGTSTDICLQHDGRFNYTSKSEFEGFPISIPTIEIHTIGAGGGSIAWMDRGGALRVGPQSAGADPGPACYGKGGLDPTVTDANLLVGHINPDYFLGGEIKLHKELAVKAIKRISEVLGVGEEEAGAGIIDVVNSNMVGGIKVVSVQKGWDPREFALVAFGGAGPMHGVALVDVLNMSKLIVPPNPANCSALGLLLTDIKCSFVQTCFTLARDLSLSKYYEIVGGLTEKVMDYMRREGIPEERVISLISADMRYELQSWELNIPITHEVKDEEDIERIVDDFHVAHERTYGYCMRDELVMFVNFRIQGIAKLPEIKFKPTLPHGGRKPDRAFKGTRMVFFEGSFIKYEIYERSRLREGNLVEGPAIVEEYASTIPIPPGWEAKIDGFGNLIITRQ